MDVNFELYKVFYVVANNKSISKGAEELMISQPAVTQSIKMLEGQLGVTLFVRTKKGVILTDEGNELYKYVKEGMSYFVNGYNTVSSLKNLNSGVLKIGASTSVTEHFLMPFLKEFHRLYPKVEVKIVNLLTEVLIKELRNGNVDIVIGSNNNIDKDLDFHVISEINDIFVSNKKIKLDVDELFQEKIIIQTAPSVSRNSFNEVIKKNNINFTPYMEVVSHHLVTELVKSGMGIGVVTKEYVLEDLKNNNLYEVDVNFLLPTRKLGYTLPKNTIPSYRVKAFIELLKKY
ncbi:MAG: LysR family transcriptional regulator [Bacilli bacterium]|nr:LysR family transcriptional regulator [Bacilli bacterium]